MTATNPLTPLSKFLLTFNRLGRSLAHLIEVVRGLSDRGIGFKSIQKSLDTTHSPTGELVSARSRKHS